jgi:hypothetical protein
VAYCLLGILDVSMLLSYGEGRSSTRRQLRAAIRERHGVEFATQDSQRQCAGNIDMEPTPGCSCQQSAYGSEFWVSGVCGDDIWDIWLDVCMTCGDTRKPQ